MKASVKPYLFLFLLALAPLAAAQDEEPAEEPAEEVPPPDAARLLNDVTEANEAEDGAKLSGLLKDVVRAAKLTGDDKVAESLAKELVDSLKTFRGDPELVAKILDTLGELHVKATLSAVQRYAFGKDPDEDEVEEQNVKAAGLKAVGKFMEPRYAEKLADESRSRNLIVAQAAYEALAFYGPAPGRVRQQVAEHLMKRLEAEYPSGGGGGGGRGGGGGVVSAEAQERWSKLSGYIVAAMQSVCRQPSILQVENWREWWKDNKKDPKAWRDKEE